MLIANNTAVGISAWGATITHFQVSGKDVIFPHQPVFTPKSQGKTTLRGGIPIALPWFGPWSEDLPRHGFLRDTLIGIAGETSEDRVQMLHDFKFPLYSEFSYSFRVSITTQVETGKVSQSILVKNTGRKPMPLNPGWHPYIAMPEGLASIEVGCTTYEVGGINPDIQWGKSNVIHLKTPDAARIHVPGLGTVMVTFPANFKQIVIWTENAKSVCVEPVLGPEAAFGNPHGHWLGSLEEERFDFSLQLL